MEVCLIQHVAFSNGINVVVDYLWGESAKTIIVAIAKTVEDATPVRFVHVGGLIAVSHAAGAGGL